MLWCSWSLDVFCSADGKLAVRWVAKSDVYSGNIVLGSAMERGWEVGFAVPFPKIQLISGYSEFHESHS